MPRVFYYQNVTNRVQIDTLDGKVPFGKAWKKKLTVNDSLLMIERDPDTFKAIGVFTGPRSDGLVMFDVDKNLGAIEKKWGKDLKKAPKVTSLKKNAAKFIFKVPQELWSDLKLSAILLLDTKVGKFYGVDRVL